MHKTTILLFFFSAFFFTLRAQSHVVTDAEALKQAHAFENASDDQRQNLLSHFLDEKSFIKRIELTCEALKDTAFRDGFLESFAPGVPRISGSLSVPANGGSYRLLREYDSNGMKHLLFRAFGNQGIAYQDFTLVKVRDSVKASDVYLFTTGEYLSNSMSTIVTAMVASQDPDKTSEQARLATKLRNYIKQKQYLAAKAAYDSMDNSMRDDRTIQVTYINLCEKISDSLYQSALERFQQMFPDAPNTYLLMIDLYYLKKDYQKGLYVVDKLDNLVGTDPALDLYRGNFCKLAGKSEESLAYYQKVYKYDPSLKQNTQLLIAAYAEAKRPGDAKKVIAEYKLQPKFRQQDLEDVYVLYPSLRESHQ
jgi:tetratricopeptide (TPR) repeat protein